MYIIAKQRQKRRKIRTSKMSIREKEIGNVDEKRSRDNGRKLEDLNIL